MRIEVEAVAPSVVPVERTSKASKEVAVVEMRVSKPKLVALEPTLVSVEMEMVRISSLPDAIIVKVTKAR